MAKYTGPKAKICRKFGENIYGNAKYDKIFSKRKYPLVNMVEIFGVNFLIMVCI